MNTKVLRRAVEITKALVPYNFSHRCRHVAFLVKNGKIVHIAENCAKSHPAILNYDYNDFNLARLHAELRVILRSGQEDLSNYELISLRIDQQGKLNMAKPCSGCQSAIFQMGIKKIFYSNGNGNIVKL